MADNYIYDGAGNKYLSFIRASEVFTDENNNKPFIIISQDSA